MAGKEISITKIPLHAIISYCINSPHVRHISNNRKSDNKELGYDDNFPLYARTDGVGYKGRSIEWLNAITKTYNSPRNIRALFITKQAVYIRYWHSGDTFGIEKEVKLTSVPTDVSKIESGSGVTATSLIDTTVKGMLNLGAPSTALGWMELTGNAFKAFKDWSLTNLEELYFDETMLIGCQPGVMKLLCNLNTITVKHDTSEKAVRLFGAGGAYTPYSVMEVSKMPRSNMEGQCIGMLMGLLYTGLGEAKDTNGGTLEFKDYPRLKFIGFIPGATANGFMVRSFLENKVLPEYNTVGSIHSLVKTAIERETQLRTGIYVDTGINLYKAPFSTNKVWLFDVDRLEGTFERFDKWAINNEYYQNGLDKKVTVGQSWQEYTEMSANGTVPPAVEVAEQKHIDEQPKVNKSVQESKTSANLDRLDLKTTNKLESVLNTTYKKLGISGVRTSLKSMVALRGEAQIRSEVSEFSVKGQEFYTSLLDKLP